MRKLIGAVIFFLTSISVVAADVNIDLILAALDGDIWLVQMYLGNGANPKAMDSLALFFAVEGDHKEIAEILLHAGADSETMRLNHGSVKSGTSTLKVGPRPNSKDKGLKLNESSNDMDIFSAFRHIIQNGDIDRVELLLGAGVNPNAYGSLSLFLAVERGYTEIVRMLLKWGVDPRARNSEALYFAVQKRYPEIVKILLNAGAELHAEILCLGVIGGDEKMINILLSPEIQNVESIVLVGFERNPEKVVAKLLEGGADPNAYDSQALFSAIEGGHIDIVKILLEAGANPNTRNLKFLYLAVERGYTEIVKIVLGTADDVKAKYSAALFSAVGSRNIEIVKMLLAWEADSNIGHNDLEILDRAVEIGDAEIVKLLLEAGVEMNLKTLFKAVVGGENEIIKIFLGSQFKDAETLLLEAERIYTEVIRILIEMLSEAEVNLKVDNVEIPHSVAEGVFMEIMKIFEKEGLGLTIEDPRLFSFVDEKERAEIIAILQWWGAGLGDEESSIFYSMAHNGYKETFKVLLEAGLATKVNTWAVFYAAEGGHVEMVKMLLEQGVDGTGCLSHSMKFGYTDIVKILLECGVSLKTEISREYEDL